MLLAQSYMGNAASAHRLRDSVEEFGTASGLFDSVDVRRLGKGGGDPFQLQITIDGLAVNILDVGYGVSQALPILVDCLRAPDKSTFLLQQPEVHLHPRAQAELGSLFGALTQTKKQRFVIETHSDHLVDRIRMDIRDGKNGLRPEDVSLLYFERKKGEVKIAPIRIDAQGNLVDPAAFIYLGAIEGQAGRLGDAERYYAAALKRQPDSAEAAAQLGALQVRAGRVLEGTAHLRAALGANPLQPLANFTLGQLMANNGRIAEARQHFERALQGHPDEAQALEIRRALDLLGPLKR